MTRKIIARVPWPNELQLFSGIV